MVSFRFFRAMIAVCLVMVVNTAIASPERMDKSPDVHIIIILLFGITAPVSKMPLISEKGLVFLNEHETSLSNRYPELYTLVDKRPLKKDNDNQLVPLFLCNCRDKFIPEALINNAGGGDGGDGDPDSYGAIVGEEGPEKKFNRLVQRVRQASFHNVSSIKNMFRWCHQAKLFYALIKFARANPEYAKKTYALMGQLNFIQTIKLTSTLAIIFPLTIDVGVASFGNAGVAIVRALVGTVRMALKSIVPLLLGDIGWVSLWSGIAITSSMDNAFAHNDNSTYAMAWGADDSVNFSGRVIASTWINNILLSIYSQNLVPLLAKPCSRNLGLFFIGDTLALTTVVYFALMAQFAGYPAFSLTAGPNPYGPAGVFPYPYCSPDFKWIPWHKFCSEARVASEVD